MRDRYFMLQATFASIPVLDLTIALDGLPQGYTAMDDRSVMKVMVQL
jgi:hypothetical protein